MKPLLLADHAALELLDTRFVLRGEPVELLGDGRALVAWLVDAGLLEATVATGVRRRFGVAALDEVAAEARDLRAWAEAWVRRWREAPDAPYDAELKKLNGLLADGRAHWQAHAEDGRIVAREHVAIETPRELLALLARPLLSLLAEEDPTLVKRCDGAECTLWFLDRTKAHRRRFCSAAACGNREKVAAFRARQRLGSSR